MEKGVGMARIVVIGAGASGLMAAYAASSSGADAIVLERNEKAGKKIYITGKGRCNLTNATSVQELLDAVPRNPKFLQSALHAFDNRDTMDFFEEHGLPLKVERGERVFPESDRASDVTRTLLRAMHEEGAKLRLDTDVTRILAEAGRVRGVAVQSGEGEETIAADAVICACGGRSYPSTGSDGTGYTLAWALGHTITPLSPSLVPMEVEEGYVHELQGLSLKNVEVTLYKGKKRVYEGFGEMLFTHFGVSGPLILSASSIANQYFGGGPLDLCIDLKPAVPADQLDRRLQRMLSENRNKRLRNALQGLLPARLAPVVLELSGVDPEKQANSVTRAERLSIVGVLKAFPCTVTGLRGFDEAIVTRGGVDVKEVNPSTMESKLVRGLYFCGEMLDVDAVTGGYNLQIAWSTGHLAGTSAARAGIGG